MNTVGRIEQIYQFGQSQKQKIILETGKRYYLHLAMYCKGEGQLQTGGNTQTYPYVRKYARLFMSKDSTPPSYNANETVGEYDGIGTFTVYEAKEDTPFLFAYADVFFDIAQQVNGDLEYIAGIQTQGIECRFTLTIFAA